MASRGKRGGQRVREKAERALELQERQDADDAALEDYLENMLREAGEEEGEAAEDQEEAGKRFAAAFVRGADMEVGDQLDGAYLDPGTRHLAVPGPGVAEQCHRHVCRSWRACCKCRRCFQQRR